MLVVNSVICKHRSAFNKIVSNWNLLQFIGIKTFSVKSLETKIKNYTNFRCVILFGSLWICKNLNSRMLLRDIQSVEHVQLHLRKIMLILKPERNIWLRFKYNIKLSYNRVLNFFVFNSFKGHQNTDALDFYRKHESNNRKCLSGLMEMRKK